MAASNAGRASSYALAACSSQRRNVRDPPAPYWPVGWPPEHAARASAAAIAALAPVIRRFMWGASFRRWCYFNPVRAVEPTIWRWNAMNKAMRGTSAIVVAAMT